MQVETLAIAGPLLITPQRFSDDRGFFSETYVQRVLEPHGIGAAFVQDNHSLSRLPGVLRGLHYQLPPKAQGKLVRVVRGSIFDVAVDIRLGSPDYGRHVSTVLSADNWRQLWVPVGFAHGFLTLEPDTEVIYKVTADYAPDLDRGIAWDDPDVAVAWPLAGGTPPTLSAKDQGQPRFADLQSPFSLRAQAG